MKIIGIIALFFGLLGKVADLLLFSDKALKNKLKLFKTNSIANLVKGKEIKVQGKIVPNKEPLKTPVTNKLCVWYKLEIYCYSSEWELLVEEIEMQDFRIRDNSGSVKVIPGYMNVSINKSKIEKLDFSENEMKNITNILTKKDPLRTPVIVNDFQLKFIEKWIPSDSEVILRGKCYEENGIKTIKSDKIKFMTIVEK